MRRGRNSEWLQQVVMRFALPNCAVSADWPGDDTTWKYVYLEKGINMGTRGVVSAKLRDEEQALKEILLELGVSTDDELDRAVGLDCADPLSEGEELLRRRELLGLSAEDLVAGVISGQLEPHQLGVDEDELYALLSARCTAGRHAGACR
jgi:hypothetical protein